MRRRKWAQAMHLLLWLPFLIVPCLIGMSAQGIAILHTVTP
jgi:hypothetical protein